MDTLPHIVWSATAEGRLEYGNSAWKAVIGGECGASVESVLTARIQPPDRDRWLERWRSALRSGQPYNVEYQLDSPNKPAGRWYLERGTPVRDSRSGAVVRWVMTATPVDDYKRMEEELKSQLNQRDNFLTILLHELRNPLAPIASALERLSRHANDASSVTMARGVIQRQLRQLTSLVDDLLDISRMSHGGIRLQRAIVDLKEIVLAAVEAATPLTELRQQKLTTDRAEHSVLLFADSVRLTQVVTNLLVNAAKFTPMGGHISITTVEKEGIVSIRVRDDGIGISPTDLPRIFELYAQAGTRHQGGHRGLGVGLAVARQLVELHGGSISVRSAGPGRGSEFTILLPGAHRPIGALR
jgi:signal transduction histidine kinase